MAFDSAILRSGASALMTTSESMEIIQMLPVNSAAMAFFDSGMRMTNKQHRVPVLASLPAAGFLQGDTGLKTTTTVEWKNLYFVAEEIACILPIPEAVLDDAAVDIWGQCKPLIVQAIGKVIDGAVFSGIDIPDTWGPSLIAGAIAAGNHYEKGTHTQGEGGVAEDMNETMALVEANGFEVNAWIAPTTFKHVLRGLRDSLGQKILDANANTVEDIAVRYVKPDVWPIDVAFALCGDASKAKIAVRSDINYKILDQAVLQDENGLITHNLAQQDMVALRVTMRLAYQVARPITREKPTFGDVTSFPFAALVPAVGH